MIKPKSGRLAGCMTKSVRLLTMACALAAGLAILGPGAWRIQAAETQTNGVILDESDQMIFDESTVQTLNLMMNAADWEAVRRGQDRWYRTSVLFRNVRLDGVGIKARSRRGTPVNFTHPNFHLDFARDNPNQRLFGQRWITTESWAQDDISLITQRIGEKLMRRFGLPAARVAHVRLYANGQYIGPYVITDRPRREMVGRYFDDSTTGNYYKLANTAQLNPQNDGFLLNPDFPDDLKGYYFEPIEPVTDDWRDIMAVVHALNDPPPEEIRQRFTRLWDVDQMIDYLAVDMSLADTDGLIAYDPPPQHQYYQNNCYFYHDPTMDRFVIIVDNALKGAFDAADPGSVSRSLTDGWDRMVITRWMLRETDLMRQYYTRVRLFMDQYYIPDRLAQEINATADLIRPAVYEDMNKPISNEDWETSVVSLRQYVYNRAANVRSQLSGR